MLILGAVTGHWTRRHRHPRPRDHRAIPNPTTSELTCAAKHRTLRTTEPRVLIEALNSTYTDPDAFGHLADTHRKLADLTVPLLSIYADRAAAQRARDLTIQQQHRVELVQHSDPFIPLEQPGSLHSLLTAWIKGLL